jgi:hypothetical protein
MHFYIPIIQVLISSQRPWSLFCRNQEYSKWELDLNLFTHPLVPVTCRQWNYLWESCSDRWKTAWETFLTTLALTTTSVSSHQLEMKSLSQSSLNTMQINF